jgi:hypothetical protein
VQEPVDETRESVSIGELAVTPGARDAAALEIRAEPDVETAGEDLARMILENHRVRRSVEMQLEVRIGIRAPGSLSLPSLRGDWQLEHQAFESALAALEQAGGVQTVDAHDLAGQEVFAAAARIPALNWTVFVESPRAEALAQRASAQNMDATAVTTCARIRASES